MTNMKKTKTQTRTKITRAFEVYDEKGTFLEKFESIDDVTDFLQISKNTVYVSVNQEKSVKSAVGKVFINYKKEKITVTEKGETPFKLPERRIVKITDLEGEIWKNIPGFPECNFLSNKGRFKLVDAFGNEAYGTMKDSKNKTGKKYKEISIERLDSNNFLCRLSRAMIRTFVDETFGLSFAEDKRIVDHIDNNSENNCLENLRVCTSSENSRYAFYEQNAYLNKGMKKIVVTDSEGEKFQFRSLNECARFYGVSAGTVWTCINRNCKIKGKYSPAYED